jgi:hypothetical protein
VGIATTLDDDNLGRLAREVNRWWTWARVVTGWDSPPWRPNVDCPMCARRGGLRVRLNDRSAACLECGETWDHTTIGLLAEHLREVNAGNLSQSAALAQLAADLTAYFPRLGPCLLCGVPGEDARHRVIDAIVSRVRAGDSEETVAADYDLPVRAVYVALASVEWAEHDAAAAG